MNLDTSMHQDIFNCGCMERINQWSMVLMAHVVIVANNEWKS